MRNAYRAILKREPDAAGWAQHLESLASGRFNKVDILASLRFSQEGERASVKLSGLALPAALRRMGRAPLIGYLIQLAIALGRLPHLLQHHRQSEFYLSVQQQDIVDHDNQTRQQLAQALAQIGAGAERAAHQQQLIELLLQRQQDEAARVVELRNEVEARLIATRQHVDESTAQLTRQMEERIGELLQRQQQLTEHLDQSAAALTGRINETAATLTQQLEASATTLTQQARQSAEVLTAHLNQSTAQLTQQVEERIEQLLRRQQQTHSELVMQERRLTSLLEKAREQPPGAFNQPLVQLMSNEEDHLLDTLYAAFEDQFRGEREEVKRRLQVYLPILKDAGIIEDVLDIGSGRGEWLELLKREGIKGRGVDRNRVFVDQCRERELEVLEEDALSYLRSLPEHSLSAVTSFHLVEHLPFETLIKLLDESIRVLKRGGLLILETPNPENFMVGSCNFYSDPTHRNPIPSPTLAFLLEARGLFRIKVMKLRPWDAARIEGDSEIITRFNEYFYSAPDYGIIGWKV